ncbi:MAG: hypothetical protein RLZZ129_104 [Verrucomicrobiota bacterium]|jgi:hypothetical protein
METLSVLMMVAFFVVVPVLAVWAMIHSTRKMRAQFERLAANLGLLLDPPEPPRGITAPPPSLVGSIRGKAVKIHVYSTGSGKSRTTWTEVVVTPVLAGDMTFGFTREGFGTRVMQLFGAKEIKVGNREFDEAWFVQTNRPDFLRAALLPELQQKFRPFRGVCKLEQGLVTYTERGLLANEATRHRFEQAMELACDLADLAEVQARHAAKG